MFGIAFVLLALFQSPAPSPSQDEITDAIAHAEVLYEAARFNDAITLLTRIDNVLSTQQGHIKEKVETKLQLALNSVGLNDSTKAKAFFLALYTLDPEYAMDGQQFSTKVMAIAADAKTQQSKVWCGDAQTNARSYLDSGQTTAFLNLYQSSVAKCTALQAMAPEAAEAFYRAGLASYKRGELAKALSSFQISLTLSPEHDLARQYADLTSGKLQLEQAQGRLLLCDEARQAASAPKLDR
jgi:tetratricopeptide (TPR) repeat protein